MIGIQTLYQSLKLWLKLQFFFKNFALTLTRSDTWLLSSPGDFDLQRVKESTYFFSWGAHEGEPAERDEGNWRASGGARGPALARLAPSPLDTRTLIRRRPAEPPEPQADSRCWGEPGWWSEQVEGGGISRSFSQGKGPFFLLDIQVSVRARVCDWNATTFHLQTVTDPPRRLSHL